ncbi:MULTISPECIES: Zn-ribbon domain-containing OB-fold protein [Achromobacter]|jgi:uncharacterized OB-fold protein|uniref:Zn-ribbon domain-containing OB-fold protein n=1 Tax=Achromobacter TaxID=222 RepID=UPI00320902D9
MNAHDLLDLQRCGDCGAWWALRPYACAACGGTALQWQRSGGLGVVLARSDVHRAPDAFWRAHVPYTLVLVRLEEGAVLMGHADAGVEIGQDVVGRAISIDGRELLGFKARRPP